MIIPLPINLRGFRSIFQGGFEINLDHRKLRTPQGKLFTVPSEALAIAVATEWDSQQDTIKMYHAPGNRSQPALWPPQASWGPGQGMGPVLIPVRLWGGPSRQPPTPSPGLVLPDSWGTRPSLVTFLLQQPCFVWLALVLCGGLGQGRDKRVEVHVSWLAWTQALGRLLGLQACEPASPWTVGEQG